MQFYVLSHSAVLLAYDASIMAMVVAFSIITILYLSLGQVLPYMSIKRVHCHEIQSALFLKP